MQWAEAWDAAHQSGTPLQKDSIVHVWQRSTDLAGVLADGFDVLLNVGYFENSWYAATSYPEPEPEPEP